MPINTSRGHLPLHHHLLEIQVFEVWNVVTKRDKRLLCLNLIIPTHYPASWGLICIAPHYTRREVSCRPLKKNSSYDVLSQGFQRLQLQIYANICKQKTKLTFNIRNNTFISLKATQFTNCVRIMPHLK